MGHDKTDNYADFYYIFFRNALLVLLPVTIIIGLILSIPHSSAENINNDKVSVVLPVSCTISGSNNTHTESLVNNTYDNSIGNGVTTLTTYCNDKNGYIIYAIGNSNNEEGNTNLVGDLVAGGNNITTGTATSGDTSNWAFEIDKLDSALTLNNAYSNGPASIPNSWSWIAKKEANTTDITSGSKITANYSIYISGTQAAGTYTGQVKYVMLHPSTAAHPTDTLEHAFALAGKQKVNIYDNNGTNSTDSSTGELIGSFYKMQDMETSICETTSLVDEQNTLQLVDTRDNKLYWVTKLQDGHCWMTQNLDLDLSHNTTLTSNDTDLNDGSLTGAYKTNYALNNNTGIITWTPKNTTRNYNTSTGTAWANSNNLAYSLDPGNWYWNGNDDTPSCNYLTTTCADFSQAQYSTTGAHSHTGNYYNWSAAIASDDSSALTTNTYGNSSTDKNATNRNPQNSICPKGWRLPTISYQGNIVNSTNGFARINGLYNSNSNSSDQGLIIDPLHLMRFGYIDNGTLHNSGGGGFYWSSTVNSSNYAYYLLFSRTNINSSLNYYKNLGLSIRCVAR